MKYIKGFDSLRAFSIILVLLTHLGLFAYLPENYFIKQRVWRIISGDTGVYFFFTLSGFLITKILLNEKKKYGSISFRIFFIRRFIRLLPPLILFYISVFFLMYFGLIKTSYYGLAISFIYLYNFVPNMFYTIELGHTWSLALEEQYYLFWPIVINYINKKGTYIITIFILALCILSFYVYPHLTFKEDFKLWRWFIPAVAPVILGSCSALIIENVKDKWVNYFQKSKTMLIVGFLLFISPIFNPFLRFSFMYQSIGICLMLIWIMFNQESKITKALDNKTLAYVGKISYGLYVYQGLFLTTGPAGKLWIQQFPQNLVLTFITAVMSFHFIEKPILGLKNKFVRKNNSQTA